jgi:hypothetical protein
LFLALRLLARAEGQNSRRLAAASLMATSMAAAAGGTYHLAGTQILWTATVYALGLAGFFMEAAGALLAVGGGVRRVVLGAAGLQLAVYGVLVAGRDDFRYVIYQHGAALLTTLALFCWASYREITRDTVWIAAAVLSTAIASVVQTSGFALHRHFNHNDLYHVIQLGTGWLFYRGFRGARDIR